MKTFHPQCLTLIVVEILAALLVTFNLLTVCESSKSSKSSGTLERQEETSVYLQSRMEELTDRFKTWIEMASHTMSNLKSKQADDDYYHGGCGSCGKYDFNIIVPGFVLWASSLFFLYLLNATVTSGRRRRALIPSAANDNDVNQQNVKGI